MQRALSTELLGRAGHPVRIAGWLHHRRRLGRLTFVLLRDRAGLAQIVFDDAEAIERVGALLPETVLEVDGIAVASDQAPGGVEVRDARVRVLSEPHAPPPLELRRPVLKEQLPTILDHAAASLAGYRAALDAVGFTEIQTPKIVASATESGANVFGIDFFGRRAYLAQSPQFYKQTLVAAFERVYEVGPVFRAEPHETGRHLAEYVSLDAEIGFIEGVGTVIEVAREAVAGMVAGVGARAPRAQELLALELPEVPAAIPRIHFADAQALIEDETGETVVGEPDLAPEHERRLGAWARREHASEFLFVVGYPMAKRPFYTHPDPERPGFSNSFDLLFRGVELMTGGQRLHRYEDYVAALAARGEGTDAYEGYLDAFRYGMPPHGGFAIGVARLVGARNVRETTLFPRDRNRLSP